MHENSVNVGRDDVAGADGTVTVSADAGLDQLVRS